LPIIEFHKPTSLMLLIIEKLLLALPEEQKCSYCGTYFQVYQDVSSELRILVFLRILHPSITNRIKAAAVIDVNKRKKILNS